MEKKIRDNKAQDDMVTKIVDWSAAEERELRAFDWKHRKERDTDNIKLRYQQEKDRDRTRLALDEKLIDKNINSQFRQVAMNSAVSILRNDFGRVLERDREDNEQAVAEVLEVADQIYAWLKQ